MFENLSESGSSPLRFSRERGKITEINVAETLKDVRRALLDAEC